MGKLISNSVPENFVEGREVTLSGITINLEQNVGMVRLQGPSADNAKFKEAIQEGICLLPKPGSITFAEQFRCHWLSLNEWLFVTPKDKEDEMLLKLAPLTQGHAALATMITDSRVIYRLSGAKVTSLLSKISTLDLTQNSFAVNSCAITKAAGIAIMLVRVQETEFEIYVDRSQAKFLFRWLKDSTLAL